MSTLKKQHVLQSPLISILVAACPVAMLARFRAFVILHVDIPDTNHCWFNPEISA